MKLIYHKGDILSYNDRLFEELYSTSTLVNATLTCCKTREFKGQYYGIPHEFIKKISDERNEYISMLTIISDKLKYADTIILSLEEAISLLHEDSNNCC